MRIYTIHRRGGEVEPELCPIKEGFCWPAALFTAAWALWHGHWVTAAALVAVQVLIGIALGLLGTDETTQGLVGLAISVIFGFIANDLRRRKLERSYWRLEDVVIAGGAEDAEWRYFAKQNLGELPA